MAMGAANFLQGKPVVSWTYQDVGDWLTNIGFLEYSHVFAVEHQIDGAALVLLTEMDLRQPPLQLKVLGAVKQIGRALRDLRVRHEQETPSTSGSGESHNARGDTCGECANRYRVSHGDELIARVEAPDTRTKSLIKTAIAASYCSISLLLTAFVMVIVHDRVPDMKTYPPLPDLFLDNVPLIPWAFEVCEMIACVMAFIWVLVMIFHKHRVIVLCRIFSLTGTVFLLRCITMLITSLSVPGVHLECKARSHDGDLNEKLSEALRIWFGMGMSLRGVRSCGDYMFSGHTTVITLLNHFITEYTPLGWHYLHTTTWVMNLFGIFFILAGHEHYSIDVFVAFYISSRLFLYYHSMANHAKAMTNDDHRTRIWFPLYWFFESGRPGRVPNEYEWPFPSLSEISDCVGRLAHLSPVSFRFEENPLKNRKTSAAKGGRRKNKTKGD